MDQGNPHDPDYVMALDQGTTSSRAIVFDHQATIVASAQQEFPQLLPAPGEVEHDPEAIWDSQLTVARQALGQSRARRPADRRASASPTSVKRSCCGTATRASRSTTRLSGRAA